MAGSSGYHYGRNNRYYLNEVWDISRGVMNLINNCERLNPPSPDEPVIQQRGHQRKSATYTFGAPDKVFFRSPTNSPPKKNVFERLSFPTRSSPRKNLNLTPEKKQQDEAGYSGLSKIARRRLSLQNMKPSVDIEKNIIAFSNAELGQLINDTTQQFPAIKEKRRLILQNMKPSVDIEKNIIALSHAQLVQLINDTTQQFPAIKETMRSMVPEPDLLPMEERFLVLKHNILKKYPRNVCGSQVSSFYFPRVRAHLEAFKKECEEYGCQFMESQHWHSVFEYILFAWKLTLGLPNWTAAAHNKVKISCIKYLSTICVTAFKMSSIDEVSLNEIIQRLEELGDDSNTKSCVTYARNLKNCD